ncbi:cytochrome c biogenesis protein [Microaerobacter geothermalis]|uniref:cytochrome c biogenesis protein n=1 Tax=Microaerobacter geothermalis TaxID=674972 RepID=UPI001F4349D4|nr:cytochrome c biogenesis protein CcsA [Microaerobacter geothermalis]MCF6095163.1 cytochrome c biogenesis protein [Microaerobacter geothermalis]
MERYAFKWEKLTLPILFVGMIIALYLVFPWVPPDKMLGVVQKIFYFHVASAWNAFLAFFVVFITSIFYLKTRNRKYDVIASVSAEIGVLFTTIVLITGPIWGRSSWNAWWSWEPRLTTTLILWFIYLAYLMVREMDGDWEKKARLSAVFGIVGFIDVPIVYMSIRWWRTKLHPVVFGEGVDQTGGGIEPSMMVTLLTSVVLFTILYIVLLNRGIALQHMKIKLEQLKEQVREYVL